MITQQIITLFNEVFNVCRYNIYDNYNISGEIKEAYMIVSLPHFTISSKYNINSKQTIKDKECIL